MGNAVYQDYIYNYTFPYISSSTYMYLTKRQENNSAVINFNVNTVNCTPANITLKTMMMNITTTTSGCYANINSSFYGNYIRVGESYNYTITAPLHNDYYGSVYMMSSIEYVNVNMTAQNQTNGTNISVTFIDEDTSAPIQYQNVSIYVNYMLQSSLFTNQFG